MYGHRGWTSDPVALFTDQTLLLIAGQDGRDLRTYARSIGQRWLLGPAEVKKLASSLLWRGSSHAIGRYTDPLSPSYYPDFFPSEPSKKYIDLAVQLLHQRDEDLLLQAMDSLEEAGAVELLDRWTDPPDEELMPVHGRYLGCSDSELSALSPQHSPDSIMQSRVRNERLSKLVVLTAKGREKEQEMRAAYANSMERREAARDTILDYLYKGSPPSPWTDHFQQDPRSFYRGQQFQKIDCYTASSYLQDKDLIRSRPTSTLFGDTLRITARGIDCIEKYRGSVPAFLASEVPKVIMGDNIENIHGSTIINRSLLVNAMNAVRGVGKLEVAAALDQVAKEIDKSGNQEAVELFDTFVNELQGEQPKRSVLRACWNGIVTVLPSITQLVDATAKIATLFH